MAFVVAGDGDKFKPEPEFEKGEKRGDSKHRLTVDGTFGWPKATEPWFLIALPMFFFLHALVPSFLVSTPLFLFT